MRLNFCTAQQLGCLGEVMNGTLGNLFVYHRNRQILVLQKARPRAMRQVHCLVRQSRSCDFSRAKKGLEGPWLTGYPVIFPSLGFYLTSQRQDRYQFPHLFQEASWSERNMIMKRRLHKNNMNGQGFRQNRMTQRGVLHGKPRCTWLRIHPLYVG